MVFRCFIALVLTLAWPAAAQNFPARPITLINPFQPAGQVCRIEA